MAQEISTVFVGSCSIVVHTDCLPVSVEIKLKPTASLRVAMKTYALNSGFELGHLMFTFGGIVLSPEITAVQAGLSNGCIILVDHDQELTYGDVEEAFCRSKRFRGLAILHDNQEPSGKTMKFIL